jgi:hypothetical protein
MGNSKRRLGQGTRQSKKKASTRGRWRAAGLTATAGDGRERRAAKAALPVHPAIVAGDRRREDEGRAQ